MPPSSSATHKIQPSPSMLRGFVLLRVIIVTTLLVSALLIQITFSIELPLNPIYYLAALAYSISIWALLSFDRLSPEANAVIQIVGDLLVITGLVYVSRGPDSGFTFLYLATISAGAVLLGRQGAYITAGIATVFYAVLVDLMYFNVLRPVELEEIPIRVWSPATLVGNVALNITAFFATALLVSTASQKLQEARADVERRKAEIGRLQALHTSVVSSLSSGLVTTDRTGVVTYANPAALELLSKDDASIVGQPVLSLGLVSEEFWTRILAADNELLRDEGLRPALGADAFFGVSATTLRDGAGRVAGKMLIFQNLTEFKKLESEVHLKEKLAAVGELAAHIAHEIRNPLASISGSAQVLRGSVPPGSSEQRLMEIVVQESHRLSSILEDFLRYVRPRERAVEPVDAPATLRDVLTLLSHSEEFSERHRLELDLQPESVIVHCDPGQLRQIFWNLARNALSAMPKGGALRVSSRLAGERWTVSLADEGHGMTREERASLFTPFAHTFRGGTGLGLAIVYRIVEQHGGSIGVDTAPGVGTTITITLPQAGPSPGSAQRLPSDSTGAIPTYPAREVA